MYLFTKEDLRVIGDGFNEPQLKIFWCKFGPISLSFLQDPAQPNPNSAISREYQKGVMHGQNKFEKEYNDASHACSSLHLPVLSLVQGTFRCQSAPASWNCPSPSASAPSGSCSPVRSSLLQIAQSSSVFLPPFLLPFASQ